ncbi:uncharacterized protein B0T15DRAFT_553856 [Chaetomium strumarium]|uniref:Peptidase M20 dimerisation domain-containing protein n=1 Tax=Chaetomium strumarium TaxID=1170767 RepID=A0AAJ0GWC0_9PEZI|nr:hypothetical protein B0T15DRAFT_553856 [Chaetomium strumarium]
MDEAVEEDGFILVPREGSDYSRGSMSKTDNADEDGVSVEYLSEISDFIDGLTNSLWPLNKFIHESPELAFREHKAHQALTSFMRSRGDSWHVTPSAYGLETAWVAVYESGRPGPTVSFNAEMDALPNLGHACGHNLIATASVAAALATAKIMKRHNIPGKVVLLGTPGEEGWGGGKIRLLERGAYRGIDVSLISHPGILHNSALVRTTAFSRLGVEYVGRAAHAAKAPWRGINALDALVVAYNAVSALRQQTMPGDVIGLAITDGGGDATNLVHAHAACVCVLRARTAARLRVLQDKVGACFRAGAEATGARVTITLTQGYDDHVPNRVLAASYARAWHHSIHRPPPPPPPSDPPMPPLLPHEFTRIMSSTDQGNISYAVPSVNASFAIPPGPLGGQPHSPDFEVASGTREAFGRALRVGKALAGTAVDVLTKEGLLAEVKRQWRRDMDEIQEEEGGGFAVALMSSLAVTQLWPTGSILTSIFADPTSIKTERSRLAALSPLSPLAYPAAAAQVGSGEHGMHGLDVGRPVAAASIVCGAAEAMERHAPEAVVEEGLAVCCESEARGSSEESAETEVEEQKE